MELILDTADFNCVAKLSKFLTVSGVTTNPAIIAKSGYTLDEVVEGMSAVLSDDQKFFVQTVSTSYEGICEEARRIAALRPQNTYVKIPVTHAGMQAIKTISSEGIGVLATAIYSADQAFLAAQNGAEYLAPYVNRMCNYTDGVKQVQDLIQMLEFAGLDTKVVAASFKNTAQVHELILSGIQAVTIPPDIALAMLDHPGTQIAVDEFSEIWSSTFGREVL